MEFLVTMTTHVPAGTLDESVNDVRAREAARSRELAAQGHLARLWRPALKPGEWRTLGLFAADDERQLEKVLASMPLRVWRSDEVAALSPHPNDPGPAPTTPDHGPGTEFLIAMTIIVPEGTPDHVVQETTSREKQCARELAGRGRLVRLWALPGRPDGRRTVGLWRARDAAEMTAVLESLPVYDWMTIETTPLTEHPNDPAAFNAAASQHS